MLRHCRHDYDVDAAEYIWMNIDKLSYVRDSALGENKDMSSEEDIANIKNKKEKGIELFRIYRFAHKGRTFLVKLAVYKKGYEEFYALFEE